MHVQLPPSRSFTSTNTLAMTTQHLFSRMVIRGTEVNRSSMRARAGAKPSIFHPGHARCGLEPSKMGNVMLGQVAGVAGAAALTLALGSAPALATDSAAVGKCLFTKCQTELARCVTDEKCLESLVCLNACEFDKKQKVSDCQIRCGDLYSDAAVSTFNTCAVTQNKCVPQIPDNGDIKIPSPDLLVPNFETKNFDGRWYIASGLNKLFDTFDCQVHYFNAPEPDKLYAKLNWRVSKPNGQFYERSDIQTFVQDPVNPGILYNHDNEFLHYQDDWYIISEKPDDYIFVYYRGSNDAWDGYGGAVIYSRTPELKPESIPEIRDAAAKVGLDFNAFTQNDNTCGPAPKLRVTRPTDLDTLFDDVIAVENSIMREISVEVKEVGQELRSAERALLREVALEMRSGEQALEDDLVSFSRGFTMLKDQVTPKSTTKAMLAKQQDEDKAEQILDKLEDKYESKSFFSSLFGIFSK